MHLRLIGFLLLLSWFSSAQHIIEGKVFLDNIPLPFATVNINNGSHFCRTNEEGHFRLEQILGETILIEIKSYESMPYRDTVLIHSDTTLIIRVEALSQQLSEMVVSGNLRPISKMESTTNVEVYSASHIRKNPTNNLFDALQNVNGVRPQINCNVCNTGDIHINGLEGPYTMVLVDGMPIISNLASVYGLNGIPNSLINRIEVIKGPASSLYGSEAIGGVINIVTKSPGNTPIFAIDLSTSTWLENSVDIALKTKTGNHSNLLSGINYYSYKTPFDKNNDGFTDLTCQDRLSIFEKWEYNFKSKKKIMLAGRYLYEDRWGGQMEWTPEFRGTDSIYGESINTNRFEFLSKFELPGREDFVISTSVNFHVQNSYYGKTSFLANQLNAFAQLHWLKSIASHDILSGVNGKFQYYDDNTVITSSGDSAHFTNAPINSFIPGIFVQDEWEFSKRNVLLMGIRYDYHSIHGSIITPRIGYKHQWINSSLRINAGTGFRTVNVFTEDHAALTGARKIILENELKPESSYNVNINLYGKHRKRKTVLTTDLSAFSTYFNNRITADYDSDPNAILYSNSSSFAVNYGLSIRIAAYHSNSLSFDVSATYAENLIPTSNGLQQQILTEKFSGNWSVGYTWKKIHLKFDYTGNVYSPMRLPLLSTIDPRPEYSPWWSIQNIQCTFIGWKKWEIYAGIKNLLNWTPSRETDMLIARSHDPFDKNVIFDQTGNAVKTDENPYGLTFDPSYVYASNQGIRGFLGVRFTFDQP